MGRLIYDGETDTWYECIHEERENRFTWTILPPEDVLPGTPSGWEKSAMANAYLRTEGPPEVLP